MCHFARSATDTHLFLPLPRRLFLQPLRRFLPLPLLVLQVFFSLFVRPGTGDERELDGAVFGDDGVRRRGEVGEVRGVGRGGVVGVVAVHDLSPARRVSFVSQKETHFGIQKRKKKP